MKKRILIVGDNLTTRALLVTALPGHEFRVSAVSSRASVVFQLCFVQPDLIILDDSQADDGVGRTLCQIREYSSVPVIVLAARNDVRVRVEALDCGADDSLALPFDPRELAARARALLRRGQRATCQGQPAAQALVP